MVELLRASVLNDGEKQVINALSGKIRRDEKDLKRLDNYYEMEQRVQQMGLAVPPELRAFETVINVPRMAVDEPTRRQRLRAFYRAGDSTKEDPALREAWEANNLGSESTLLHTEEKIFGRAFVAVGTNEDDAAHPLITVESPREIACDVDTRHRRIRDAFRMYRDETEKVTRGTLYRFNTTVHVVRGRNGWVVEDTTDAEGNTVSGRDDHELGAVPLVMFVNRRRAGKWAGRSEMHDIIPLTDGIARLITNMQVAGEALAVPHRWAAGMSKADFIDPKTGKMLATWEAYFTAIMATANKDAKFGTFEAAQLSNFHQSVDAMLAWCASSLGLPTRYAGQQTVNPAAEGAIRADESRLITNVETKNTFDGDAWAWVMGLEERIRTEEWGDPNSIRALWFDPGTPTYSQRADSLTKLRSVGGISIEGMWDEMGWDEARKTQEKARLDAEAQRAIELSSLDPLVGLTRDLMNGGTGAPAGGR